MEISKEDAEMIEHVDRLGDGIRCNTCKFYSPVQTVSHGDGKGFDGMTWDKFGRCHRYPPKEVGTSCHTKVSFPAVAHDDWCGEHVEMGA